MAARRPRNSLGAANAGASVRPESTLEAFEDFRRRHSRQNKEIIIENAIRRTTIKSLQEEIAALRVELLDVRQANIYLSAQVKRLHHQKTKVHGDATKVAIDHILSAVPALRQLRDHLGASSPAHTTGPFSDVHSKVQSKEWVLQSNENPTATRPAACAAEMRGLGSLQETSEYGSDASQSDLNEKRTKHQQREQSKARRRTDIGSIAASRSPRPNQRKPVQEAYIEITSPSSSTCPSPEKEKEKEKTKAVRSPVGEKKHKRRRESGLLAPPRRSPSPPAAMEEIPDWDEGRNVILAAKPEPTVSTTKHETGKGKERAVGTVRVRDIAVGLADAFGPVSHTVENTVGNQEGVAGPIGGSTKDAKRSSQMSAVPEEPIIASGPSSGSSRHLSKIMEGLPTADSAADNLDHLLLSPGSTNDDDGGRGRRSRKSVNYKEPSLTKKMRKPDGVTVEDSLKLPRASMSASSISPSTSDPAFGDNEAVSRPSGSTSTKRGNATQHLTSMRRKSVLPKSGSRARTRTPAENEDEDEDDGEEPYNDAVIDLEDLVELDASPDLDVHTALSEPRGSITAVAGTSKAAETTSLLATTGISRTTGTTMYSRVRGTVPPPQSLSSIDLPPAKSSVSVQRTTSSPRKAQPLPKRTDSLGVGRPISHPTSRFVSASASFATGRPAKDGENEKERERGALIDRPLDNGRTNLSSAGSRITSASSAMSKSKGSSVQKLAPSAAGAGVGVRKVSRRVSSVV